jgi:pimeloyl-ACP methyl ester carboxylesterase
LTFIRLLREGFTFYRNHFPWNVALIPIRPAALLQWPISPAKHISYWYRPHTSKSKLPVLFIHGIGIGLYPYVDFLAELDSLEGLESADTEDQVGIIAVELMPISFRITHSALSKDEMCKEIAAILAEHGWTRVVTVAHSYGNVVATQLIHHPLTSHLIGPLVLIDPVSLLLHLPDVAHNFTRRKPMHANEHQLYYFASMDTNVAHTLGRCFFWAENILWKEEISGRRATVALMGRDLIMNTDSVGRYLCNDSKGNGAWKSKSWTGEGLDVLWYNDLDHAQVFDRAIDRSLLVKAINSYCSEDSKSKAYYFEKMAEAQDIRQRTKAQTEPVEILKGLTTTISVDQSQAALPCHFFPFGHNPNFYGRKAILQAIKKGLTARNDDPQIRSVALWGAGGNGKSQIALEYASLQDAAELPIILWVSSEKETEVASAFSKAAQIMNLPGVLPSNTPNRNRDLVLEYLQRTG